MDAIRNLATRCDHVLHTVPLRENLAPLKDSSLRLIGSFKKENVLRINHGIIYLKVFKSPPLHHSSSSYELLKQNEPIHKDHVTR